MTRPKILPPQLCRLRRGARRIAIISWVCMTLGGCGLSADNHPRDIDPAKQDLLQSSTTTVTTPNNNP